MTFESYLATLRGKQVAVIGIGVSNIPLIKLFLKKGSLSQRAINVGEKPMTTSPCSWNWRRWAPPCIWVQTTWTT